MSDEYGLWVQIVDETGQEIFSHNKPAHCPESYGIAQLVALSESRFENGHTVFLSSIVLPDRTLNYVVGFPYAVGKATLYYNGENVARLSPFTKNMVLVSACVVVLAAFAYAFWLSRKLSTLIGGIRDITDNSYKPVRETGIFGEAAITGERTPESARRAADLGLP